MNKLLLLLALIALFPASSRAEGFLDSSSTYPCETYEPNCDGQDDRGDDNGWDDDGEDERPEDPNGPDYGGSEDEI